MKHLFTLKHPHYCLMMIIISFHYTVSTPSENKRKLDSAITAPISCGELIDKITILEIKAERIELPDKLQNIYNELEALVPTYLQLPLSDDLEALKSKLKDINICLWDIEEELRIKEKEKLFDNFFIELARQVYIINDQRALIKRQINELLGSHLIEEKSYSDY